MSTTREHPTDPTDVYVLQHTGRDYTDIVAVYTTLAAAQAHYSPTGPGAFTPVQPWTETRTHTEGEPTMWHTRFTTGNNGSLITIHRHPLRDAA